MASFATELNRSLRSLFKFAGHKITLLKSGKPFFANISGVGVVDPGLILGADPREQIVIRCLRTDAPEELLAGDAESNVPIDIDGNKYTITRREDSVSNPIVKFTAVKNV